MCANAHVQTEQLVCHGSKILENTLQTPTCPKRRPMCKGHACRLIIHCLSRRGKCIEIYGYILSEVTRFMTERRCQKAYLASNSSYRWRHRDAAVETLVAHQRSTIAAHIHPQGFLNQAHRTCSRRPLEDHNIYLGPPCPTTWQWLLPSDAPKRGQGQKGNLLIHFWGTVRL